MDYCDIGSARIAYRVFGNGEKTLVIDAALGSCSAEWWHIGEALSNRYKILVYDRAGYGESTVSAMERTPENIALELSKLLKALGLHKNIVLIGHSQGGLNTAVYASIYPEQIKGLILIDPATPFDIEFKEKLTLSEYKKSGVDKTRTFKAALDITSLGLGFIIKPLLAKSPPFNYHEFSHEAKEYLLKALCRKTTYRTAINEYKYTHDNENTSVIAEMFLKHSLMDIPLILLTHSSDVYVKELIYYGSLDLRTAQKIESIWQDIMKRCCSLSESARHIIASNSSHYIHLTDLQLLKNSIDSFFPG